MNERPLLSLHGAYSRRTSLLADLSLAQALGYDGIELWMPKINAFLASNGSLQEIKKAAGMLRITMLDVLLGIERTDSDGRRDLLAECVRMAQMARELDCSLLQVVALGAFACADAAGMRRQLRDCLDPLADVARQHGVRLGLEPVSFSPFRSLAEAVELIYEVGVDALGLVLDTWHLWTSETKWTDVMRLNSSLVACAHLSDSLSCSGEAWSDTDRRALPGEGVVPLKEAVVAICATGFSGSWAVEVLGEPQETNDPFTLARDMRDSARRFLVPSRQAS